MPRRTKTTAAGSDPRKKAGKTKQPPVRHALLKRFFTGFGVALFAAIVGLFVLGLVYQRQHHNDPVEYGVSFSRQSAEEFKIPWKDAYTALLSDLKFRKLRLVTFWEKGEPTRGTYDFKDVDWQMDQAAKHGAKVSLSIGLRQPRWPECHQPKWARQLYREDKAAWKKELFAYMQATVERYRDHPALESWHLENEYYNKVFGLCDDFSNDRLQQEIDLIHAADPKHQVVSTLADQWSFPRNTPRPDAYSTSLYLGNYVKFLGYFRYPVPSHFFSAQAHLIKLAYDKDMYIHELQMEPWGSRPLNQMSLAEQDHYLGLQRMKDTFRVGRHTGMKKMYLWGAEWWYWRKTVKNDPSVWETIRQELDTYAD